MPEIIYNSPYEDSPDERGPDGAVRERV